MTERDRAESVGAGETAIAARGDLVDSENVQVSFVLNGGMSTGATERFRGSVRNFGNALIREIYRLEETERVPGEHLVEITTSMVVKADEVVRNPNVEESKPPSTLASASPIAGTLSGLIAGIFGSYLHSWWQWALCVLFGVLAFLFLVLGTFEIRRRS